MTITGLRVGVVGGTGHTGGEVCRLLVGHPEVATILPTSREPQEFVRVHPNLRGSGLGFVRAEELAAGAAGLDVVFFCTPSGEAMTAARHYLEAGAKVIDLSADFRFADPDLYAGAYGREHTDPPLAAEAVYGVTELHRDDVRRARLVANPGCYAITAILALAPLLESGLVDTSERIGIHAVNGTSGAGNTPRKEVLVADMAGSLLPYSLDGHRHAPELETFLSTRTGRPVAIDLNTAHGDFARGIHLQANFSSGARAREQLIEILSNAYPDDDPMTRFVHVNRLSRAPGMNVKDYSIYPSLNSVVGSNHCHIGVDLDPVRGIGKVVAVTDNLVKGAAGSAIQNMNVMCGLPEELGLTSYAL